MSPADGPEAPAAPTSLQRDDGAPPGVGNVASGPFDREPPWSLEAEVSVLGGILMDPDSLARVVEWVDDSMFFREGHRRLFRTMVRLFEEGTAIDAVTVGEHLERTGELEPVGGLEFLGSVMDAVPTAANIEYHARIVREKALLRRLVEASSQIIRDVYDQGDRSVAQVVDLAEQKIFRVAESHDREGFTWIKEILYPTFEHIEQLQQSDSGLTGVATGFPSLDGMTTGLQAGDFAVVAARPSMGKTAWVLNVAQNAAIDDGVPVAIFSLEMSKEQLVQRLLCAEGRVDAQRLRRGQLSGQEYQRLAAAAGKLNTAPIWIDDSAGTTVLEMRAKARRLKSESDLGLLIIDYLQLMSGHDRAESRQQEVSQISRSLKALARELDVPVIALSQLSRGPEQRTDRRPQLADLRDSGSIEQDADLVMFLYRPEYYEGPTDRDGNSLEGKAELIVGKQRNGPVGLVTLYFHKDYARFDELTQEPEETQPAGPPPGTEDPFGSS